MTSKSNEPKAGGAASEEQVPASVIAQAEAAIYGNFEDQGTTEETRQAPTVAEQSTKGGGHATREKRSGTTSSRHGLRPTASRSNTR